LPCTNVTNGEKYRLAIQQTPHFDRVIPQTFGSVLRTYLDHPESKSLGPDGAPCGAQTRGLLQRARVTARRHRYIGKETDRHGEQGDDMSIVGFRAADLQAEGDRARASATVRKQMRVIGRREMMRRTSMSQHTLEKVEAGQPVRLRTLQRIVAALDREA
jgi:hypothetical protein